MIAKEYPKVVVLRKGLVIVVFVFVLLIVMLIVYNLYYSSQEHPMKAGGDDKVQAIASQSDVNWYQHESIHTPTAMNQSRQISNLSPMALPSSTNVTIQPTQMNGINSQQNLQNLQKAMSAPISSNQITVQQQVSSSPQPGGSLVSDGQSSSESDQNLQSEKRVFIQSNSFATDDDYLGSELKNPITPYEIQAGTKIPGILIDGINSDLPGQITAQVRSNVYDSMSGNYVLIPQGSKITGLYDSQIVYGQKRVLIVWKRIIFPNGQSIDLQGMPGVDMEGYAGFKDQVDNHYFKIMTSVIVMSGLAVGAQLSQPQQSSVFTSPTVGQTLAQSLGTNIANTGNMMVQKDLNIQPTLKIRPGYEFNISVTKDIIFPAPYHGNY